MASDRLGALAKVASLPTLPTLPEGNFVEGVSLFADDGETKSVSAALADRAAQLGGEFPGIFDNFAMRRAYAQAEDDAVLKRQAETAYASSLRRVTITPPPGAVSPRTKPRPARAVSPPLPAPKKRRTCRITVVDTPHLRLSRTVSLDSLSP